MIAAITSCTNTSNPSVLIAAGLVAKKAAERGLATKPWVKTSLAPGSKAVTEYLIKAGLMRSLEQMRFFLVGYGCTTCIGNSGPLPPEISKSIADHELIVCSVLSGNRNFEGRVHPEVRANYLASPPLVVAYALAGKIDFDFTAEPLGTDPGGKPVFLKDLWPTQKEVLDTVRQCVQPEMFARVYKDVYTGDETWRSIKVPGGDQFAWHADSTYVKHPPYFEQMPAKPGACNDIHQGARASRSARRQHHDRPHLSRRLHQERQPRGQILDRPRRSACRLQLLRFPARQPRSHDPRHLRQRAS